MPPIATAIATEDAPMTPASSKSGAKARPVAGPPVSVTDPARTPNSGCSPNPMAISHADDVLHDGEDGRQQEEAQHLRARRP